MQREIKLHAKAFRLDADGGRGGWGRCLQFSLQFRLELAGWGELLALL